MREKDNTVMRENGKDEKKCKGRVRLKKVVIRVKRTNGKEKKIS